MRLLLNFPVLMMVFFHNDCAESVLHCLTKPVSPDLYFKFSEEEGEKDKEAEEEQEEKENRKKEKEEEEENGIRGEENKTVKEEEEKDNKVNCFPESVALQFRPVSRIAWSGHSSYCVWQMHKQWASHTWKGERGGAANV